MYVRAFSEPLRKLQLRDQNRVNRVTLQTFIADVDLLFSIAREVDDVLAICVDVQQVNTRAEVFHQRAQGPRIDSPVVYGFVFVELGMYWSPGLERKIMCCSNS